MDVDLTVLGRSRRLIGDGAYLLDGYTCRSGTQRVSICAWNGLVNIMCSLTAPLSSRAPSHQGRICSKNLNSPSHPAANMAFHHQDLSIYNKHQNFLHSL